MSSSEPQKFDLPAHLDLDAVDNIRDWLMPAMDQGAVEFGGSAVERASSNCLLLLVAAARDAEQHGSKVTLSSPSEALCDAIHKLGFDGLFATMIGST